MSGVELSLLGSLPQAAVQRLLDALERSCGPGSDWNMLETMMRLDKSPDVHVRWMLGRTTMELAQYTPLRVTARSDGTGLKNSLEQVQCWQLTSVREGLAEHLKTLGQVGYQRKCAAFHRGKLFTWGKAIVTVSQVFVPGSSNPADFTKRLLTHDWCVKAVIVCAATNQAEEAAAVLMGIQHVLRDRVALFK